MIRIEIHHNKQHIIHAMEPEIPIVIATIKTKIDLFGDVSKRFKRKIAKVDY